MIPILIIVVLGLAIGVVRGGSLAQLGRARLRLVPLVFAGLAVQLGALFISNRAVAVGLTVLASLAVMTFAVINGRITGMALIVLGAAMNLTVVLANGGMPLSRDALDRAGLEDPFVHGRPPAVHRLLDDDTRLRFLADVIGLPVVGRVFSPGDLVLWTGLLLVVQDLMLPRGRRRARAGRRDEATALPEADA